MKIKELKDKVNQAIETNIEKGNRYLSLLQELHIDIEEPKRDYSFYRHELGVKEAVGLSAHVYGKYPDFLLPEGWKQTNDYDNLIFFSSKELKATLYVKEEKNKKLYAYCFAGTEATNGKDWANNLYQTVGLSYDYAKAVKNAKLLSKELQNSKLFFVGHSKGGGEAMLCSMVTGRPSIVFNPAPVSNLTKFLNNIKSAKNIPIEVYVSKNDPLYNSNEIVKLIGNKTTKLFQLIGFKIDGEIHEVDMTNITNITKEHSIKSFILYYQIPLLMK